MSEPEKDIIDDRYVLGDRLGLGGMSTVVLAFDRTLERHVAVKLLADHLADDAQFVSRFRREALSAARLVHPNIVQVYDFGTDEPTGRQYIVMEYVRGRSGAELLREHGVLPLSQAIPIVVQACRGLSYAHRNGVIHRDVKPGNLLRSQDNGVVKLADFGIAKAMTEESSITQVGSVLGTAAYLSPEQAAGKEAGPRADLYSLGVVTYQLVTGRLPYDAVSLTELALKQQREAPALADDVNPDVPHELALAIDRALALEPEARFVDADAMLKAIEDGTRGIAPGPPPPGGAPSTAHTRLADLPPPSTAATNIVRPDETAATNIAPGVAAGAAAAGAAAGAAGAEAVPRRVPRPPREPRPGTAPAPAGAPGPGRPPQTRRAAEAAARGEKPKKKRRGMRMFVILLIVFLLLAGVVAALIATSDSSSMVHLRRVLYDDVNQTVDAMRQLVNDNTK
jgi:serine/threonine-protein kinase